jgi:ubiquinol-cytochrome c reductase cytochrome b subunit
LVALISVHLAMVVRQKHSQFPGPGRTEHNVVGSRFWPSYTLRSLALFAWVVAVLFALGGLVQINPVWLYGPYNPAEVTAGSQPDWYMAWLDGAVRLMPGIESEFWGVTISWNVVVPALLMPPLFIGFVALYPFLEQWITGDKREHHLLDRPRNVPTRTGIGAGIITFYGVLWLNSGNDIVATHFGLSINAITWVCRVLIFLGPVLAFWITRRIAISLQRADRERVLHGLETGVMTRSPDGEYAEKHAPISPYEAYTLTAREDRTPYELGPATDDNGVVAPRRGRDRIRAALSRFYFAHDVPNPAPRDPKPRELDASGARGSGGPPEAN